MDTNSQGAITIDFNKEAKDTHSRVTDDEIRDFKYLLERQASLIEAKIHKKTNPLDE